MQASIIQELLSKKYISEKLQKLVSERKEMNEASLDASLYKGDICKFLENLTEDEFVKILGQLYKEIQEGFGGDQDLENQDATDTGDHGANISKGSSMETNLKEVKVVASGGYCQDQTQDLGDQDASDADYPAPSNKNNMLKEEEEKEVQSFDNPVQLTTGDMSPHTHDIRDDLSSHNTRKGQLVKRQSSQEFPSQEPPALNQQKDSKYHHLALKSAPDDENKELQESVIFDDCSSSSVERITESDEMSDSNGSTVGSGGDDTDSQPGSPSPTQACADDNRNILLAIEHVEPQSRAERNYLTEPHNDHRSSHAHQDRQEEPNLLLKQRELDQLVITRLTETLCNNSRVAVVQANRETQNIQGTLCSNCDALQQENDELKDQLVTLEQQRQEEIATNEESLRDHENEISLLSRQRQQLHAQIGACEQVIHDLNEEKKDNKKIIDFLIERNKHWQEECAMANKRAYKFAQKAGKDYDALQKTMSSNTKVIEKVQKRYMAEKQENKMLKEKIKKLEDKWKEKGLDEEGALQGQGNLEQRHMPRHRTLRDLQCNLFLHFLPDEQENDLAHQQDEDIDHQQDDDID